MCAAPHIFHGAAKTKTHAMPLNRKELSKPYNCCAENTMPSFVLSTPVFCHQMIVPPPHLPFPMRAGVASVGDCAMGTTQDHRKWAEECVAMARAADDHSDKALWLTLAQSWMRLAEHVARNEGAHCDAEADVEMIKVGSSN
jgi:hypothetical protein